MQESTSNTADTADALQQCIAAIEQQIHDKSLEVPLLPEVANRVIGLSQSPDADINELATLIQSDPALAAHVMRIANSAAYTPNASLVSLQQAITRLGMNLIVEIAVAASISTKMFKAPGYGKVIDQIWKHALATALWSKEIARQCRINVEATFLCGLLHSIGQPVALQAACDAMQSLSITLEPKQMQMLIRLMHKTVGLQVLEEWQMPIIIREVLMHMNDYDNAEHGKEQANIVSAAARFATHFLNPERLSLEQLQQSEALADLNLYQDEVEQLIERESIVRNSMESMSPA